MEERAHEVTVTKNGEQCLDVYHKDLNNSMSSLSSTGNYDEDHGSSTYYNNTLALSQLPFDIVILDYRMPGRKDGIDVAKEIFDRNPNQRIILLLPMLLTYFL